MLELYETSLYEWIDDIVAKGDEDALFASGYLQGHFAVAISQLEVETVQGIDALGEKMDVCLELAKKELDDTDFALVASAWQQLNERLSA
ncbi:YfcL protein [Shewanella psychrophila]|uniref:YfcL protein n=1 Tax=Shewanella psychrophila TaxID=225848 RepID=A0A1S6HN65_9GAMM|nr:YfcL family protein [Shewanella psychrophila]AQS36944.1 YfcL protein [Shewanella psychrophila]